MKRTLCTIFLLATFLAQLDCNSVKMPSDLELEATRRSCAWLGRCGYIGLSEVPDCITVWSPAPEATALRLDELVAAGRATIDDEAVNRCLDALSNEGCTADESHEALAVCPWTSLLHGNSPTGTPCLLSVECADGFCSLGTRAEVADCASTCKPWLRPGEPCNPALSGCAPSSFCDPVLQKCEQKHESGGPCRLTEQCAGNLLCLGYTPVDSGTPEVLGQCSPRRTAGEPCVRNRDSTSDCALGLFCDILSTPSRCAARRAVGETCLARDGCQDGLTCMGTEELKERSPAVPGTCQSVVDQLQPCQGRPFWVGSQALVYQSNCPGDSICGISKSAENGRYVSACLATQIDEGCLPYKAKLLDGRDFSIPQSLCQSGAYCDQTDHCKWLVPLGSPCTPQQPDPCQVGSCNPQSRRCEISCSP